MCVLSFIANTLSANKDAIEALKNLCEVVAIGIGGIWTYYFFVLKRQRFPRATLEQKILHWPVCDGKIALRVTVTIRNCGEVLLKLDNGFTWVQCVKPLSKDFEDEIKSGADLVREKETEIQWPLIGERNYFLSQKMEVEPGESDEVISDIVIDSYAEKLLIYSHIQNESKKGMTWLDKINSNGVGEVADDTRASGGGMGWNVSTLVILSDQKRERTKEHYE
jgi:hypothetical protein